MPNALKMEEKKDDRRKLKEEEENQSAQARLYRVKNQSTCPRSDFPNELLIPQNRIFG